MNHKSESVDDDLIIKVALKVDCDQAVISIPQGNLENIKVKVKDDQVEVGGKLYRLFKVKVDDYFVVRDIPVGQGFHWEHLEDQAFRGTLIIRNKNKKLQIINELGLDQYLCSVVGSEMKADLPGEYLKLHAVVARTAALSMMKAAHPHQPYDLCADDHCQDYRGILRESSCILNAVMQTSGQVVHYKDEIADLRFSKICGGLTMEYGEAWPEFNSHPYLIQKWDAPVDRVPDISRQQYIEGDFPEVWCSPSRGLIPGFEYVPDYFRWTKFIDLELIRENLHQFNYEVGKIRNILISRINKSFRNTEIKIIGEKGEAVIKGELNIRKILSSSTLFSACFNLTFYTDSIKLQGAGWGHGVGMCQIGALQMAVNGYKFQEILQHYFPGVELKKLFSPPPISPLSWEEKRPCYEYANCYQLHRCAYGKSGNGPLDCKGSPPYSEL
ncbi:MAG: SpoIID/LytB domain-containing protein [bacterium]